ncbi:MAG: hypothetical protein WB523_10890 [Candidatus Sulfotelmatobacter sp.]
MKRLLKLAPIAVLLMIGVVFARDSGQSNENSNSQNPTELFVPGTIIRAELTKSVDAKRAKVGDRVTARFVEDFLPYTNDAPAPRGLRVVGHVAEVSLRHGESASKIGITFDKIILRNGTEVPIKLTIQAIGRPEAYSAGSDGTDSAPGSGGKSPLSLQGAMGTGINAPTPVANVPASDSKTAATTPGMAANGQLTREAQGVVGISGMSLASGGAEDSVISSQKHNLQLIGGTQLILCVVP